MQNCRHINEINEKIEKIRSDGDSQCQLNCANVFEKNMFNGTPLDRFYPVTEEERNYIQYAK